MSAIALISLSLSKQEQLEEPSFVLYVVDDQNTYPPCTESIGFLMTNVFICLQNLLEVRHLDHTPLCLCPVPAAETDSTELEGAVLFGDDGGRFKDS